MRPELRSVALVDAPAAWEALGFAVTGGVVAFHRVCLRLGARAGAEALESAQNPPSGLAPDESDSFRVVETEKSDASGTRVEDGGFRASGRVGPALDISDVAVADLDGVPLVALDAPPPASSHPNGVIGIDHFVLVTPDFERTAAAADAAGMGFRRVRDAGGFRQGFRRLGPAILEVVEAKQMKPGPARFWGLTLIASDLDGLKARLGERLHAPKDAVQPGRRIATLDRSAGLSVPVAFMTPAAPTP